MYGWKKATNFEAFGFAQSHCSSATFTTKTKSPHDRIYPWTETVPARWVYVHRHLNLRDWQHVAGISTNNGNFTGLSARAWN